MSNKFKFYKERYKDKILWTIENSDNELDFYNITINENEKFTLGNVIYKIQSFRNSSYLIREDTNEKLRIYNKVEVMLCISIDEIKKMKRVIISNTLAEKLLREEYGFYEKIKRKNELSVNVDSGSFKVIYDKDKIYISDGNFKYESSSLEFSDYNYLFILKNHKILESYISKTIFNNKEKIDEIRLGLCNFTKK